MKRNQLFNQLTLASLILAAIVAVYYLLIFIFPQFPLNPLKPVAINFSSTAPIAAVTTIPPTASNQLVLPPTWTPTPLGTPLPLRPTFTPEATRSTRTPVPSSTPTLNPLIPTRSPYKFTATTPFFTSNVYGVGCGGWFGVGGQVFGVDGAPLSNVSVVGWGGPISDQSKQVSVSGKDNHLNKFYGAGAYEFYLGTPNDFDFFVTVYENGRPVAPTLKLRMTNDCARDLVLINFQQNH
jgi:hypothetical protein